MTDPRPPEIRMAEDIAAQFRHLPDDEAVAAVLNHVTMFWDPRMRSRLVSLVASASTPVDPVVVRVAEALSAATSVGP